MRRPVGKIKYSSTAFTIVELLIVIVVVAILAAISVVAYNGIQQRARTSTQQYSLAEIEREIMTYALQENGESISLSGTLVGYQQGSGVSTLSRPLSDTSDITMYLVQDIVNLTADYPTYSNLTPYSSNNQVFRLQGGPTDSSNLGYRIDTPIEPNVTKYVSGYRVPGTTVIGWLQVSNDATTRSFAYNQAAAHNTASLASHAGWDFTGINLASSSKAALVFNAAHNETTRAQVIDWLAKKYNVNYE